MHALAEAGKIKFVVAQIAGLEGEGGQLTGVRMKSPEAGEWVEPCDSLLPFYGLTMKLGPIAGFGLNLEENLITVDTEKFETRSDERRVGQEWVSTFRTRWSPG